MKFRPNPRLDKMRDFCIKRVFKSQEPRFMDLWFDRTLMVNDMIDKPFKNLMRK